MEETVHDITTKIRQRKECMTYTDKDYVEGSFKLKKPRSNNILGRCDKHVSINQTRDD